MYSDRFTVLTTRLEARAGIAPAYYRFAGGRLNYSTNGLNWGAQRDLHPHKPGSQPGTLTLCYEHHSEIGGSGGIRTRISPFKRRDSTYLSYQPWSLHPDLHWSICFTEAACRYLHLGGKTCSTSSFLRGKSIPMKHLSLSQYQCSDDLLEERFRTDAVSPKKLRS